MNPKLSEHLDQRIELLKSLKELSVQQHEAIDSRRTDDLLRLLSRRERLTESLLSGASGFDRAVIEWKSTDQSDAAYLNSRIEEAESLLKEILDRDAQDEAAIRETRGEISEEIAGVGAAHAARQAYRGGGMASSSVPEKNRFTDERG